MMEYIGHTIEDNSELKKIYECSICRWRTKYPNEHKCIIHEELL